MSEIATPSCAPARAGTLTVLGDMLEGTPLARIDDIAMTSVEPAREAAE